jgi:hypothetical protein
MQSSIVPGFHNALTRDRSRKDHNARLNPALYCQVATGDGDKDLVPDPVDQCPDTPPLTPTLDNGCPDPTPISGPGVDKMQRLRAHSAVHFDPTCAAAPPPETPSVWTFLWVNSTDGIFVFTRPTNQPDGCALYYEANFTALDAAGLPISFHMMFAESEGTVNPSTDGSPVLVMFDVSGGAGDRGGLIQFLKASVGSINLHWFITVRVMNGSGTKSQWSPVLTIGNPI